MKSIAYALAAALVFASVLPTAAEARRLGGGSMSGMQRSLPPRAAPAAIPARSATAPQAAPTTAAQPAAAAAPKRNWLGPIAGLAAGLGIAALMSHLGFGAGFGNLLTMLLVFGLAFFAIRFLMRRFAGNGQGAPGAMRYATAGAPPEAMRFPEAAAAAPLAASAMPPAANSALPSGFDAAGFERIAKMIFIRLQAANDAGDLADLRAFTTPEMFASAKLDLQERGSAVQRTDVVRVDAEVLDVATEAERQIVSVRFHGLIREEIDGTAAPFDEVWHLVRPADGSREWAIAGIQPSAPLAQAA